MPGPYRTAAQTGESYDSMRWNPRAAQDYMSGAEQASYTSGINSLAGAAPTKAKGMKKYQAQHQTTADAVSRLRDLAAGRALGDYQQDLTQYSKPWKVAPAAGIIAQQDVTDPSVTGGTRSFGALGVDAANQMKGKLASIAGGAGGGGAPSLVDPALMGNPKAAKTQAALIKGYNQGAYIPRSGGLAFSGAANRAANARKAQAMAALRFNTDVTNPSAVYAGMGGFRNKNSGPVDFGY